MCWPAVECIHCDTIIAAEDSGDCVACEDVTCTHHLVSCAKCDLDTCPNCVNEQGVCANCDEAIIPAAESTLGRSFV